jgi:hypothetical protein
MLLEKLACRRSGDEVGRHDAMACAQEVAIMLGPAHELVDEAGRIAGAEQIGGELIEDGPERVGPQSADVMGPLKEQVEHGCPPGEEMGIPGRASGLCGAMPAGE